MAVAEDRELEEYRTLVEAPEEYGEGFGWRTVVGAVFIGLIMMPGSIYLGLVAGQSMGAAAEWTTIILFIEVARRSFQVLRKQEIYILYYVAGGLTGVIGVVALSGGPFANLIWNQFLRAQAGALVDDVPDWVAPHPDSAAIAQRTFLHPDWVPAILLLVVTTILSRGAWLSFGYVLFRVTSDGERLPFPMAPIAAQGATALAESSAKAETWRWRVFSIGTIIGLGFGLIYIGVPTISDLILVRPISILPIPWVDFTHGTERILPATPTGIATDLSAVFIGFVLPYWMVVGSALAAGLTMVVNPILQVTGNMPTWQAGMETTRTAWAASIDVWLSFGIGTAFAVAALGVWKMARQWRDRSPESRGLSLMIGSVPRGRGDFSLVGALGIFLLVTTIYVILCRVLVKDFPIIFVIIYGYIWTPLESYINARMIGLTGQFVSFPMVREATFILSRYEGVDIWFAPIPLANYGPTAQRFREVELTGTKFTSVIKAEVLMLVVMLPCSFLFWSFVWSRREIPSVSYPYAMKFWDFQALQQWLWYSATTKGGTQEMFQRAIKPFVMGGGFAFGVGTYALLSRLGWPVMLIYGVIRGLGMFPHIVIPQLAGALIGRCYLARRYGRRQWQSYTPVLYAGFACGMGLIGMLSIAMALVSQSISPMPF